MIIKIIFTIFLIICALINCIAFILILKKKEKFSKLGEVNDPFNVFLSRYYKL